MSLRVVGIFPVITSVNLDLENFTGADYDLASCGPGDLDPHAVSSVLKAFLRERGSHFVIIYCAPAHSSGFQFRIQY